MAQVLSIQAEEFKRIYKCFDELDKIADRMEGYANELDEMERDEHQRPALRLVKK